MSDSTPPFPDLLQRLRDGDPAAANAVFQRYASQLVRLASARLTGVLRQKVDAEDLVQSAFGSFFRVTPDAFTLGDWDDLWAILATITLRKCRYQMRRFLTGKRDIGRERGGDETAAWEAVAGGPTPAEAAELTDTLTRFLDRLDDRERLIAELTLQGHSPAEIAPRAGLTERSVYRQLDRIRTRLSELSPGP